jgi:uncharacterized protein YceH (UPF0502 family)
MSAGFGSMTRIEGLSPEEVRVLGCLLEKQRTTPDQYPLSLNALRLACNQSTNREPVVDYDEATVRDALHRLERRRLVRFTSGSRTAKYRHLLEEVLPLDDGERAILAVLMLRDAQTPGELKQRTERMHSFADLAGVHETLERLIERELVRRMDRRPGQKEERYAQRLGEDVDDAPTAATAHAYVPPAVVRAPAPSSTSYGDVPSPMTGSIAQPMAAPPPPASPSLPAQVPPRAPVADGALEQRVERLEAQVAELRAELRALLDELA